MKKLHSLAFCALVTPVITLGVGSVLAQQPAEHGVIPSTSRTQSDQSMPNAKAADSQTAADRMNMRDGSKMQNRGYMASAPANGMQSSDLVGAEVKTLGNEEVGPVEDLIINEDGQIVAIVIGVGGFLGMGERAVAIGWDDVTKTGRADELELQIDVTRESLGAAPEFAIRD